MAPGQSSVPEGKARRGNHELRAAGRDGSGGAADAAQGRGESLSGHPRDSRRRTIRRRYRRDRASDRHGKELDESQPREGVKGRTHRARSSIRKKIVGLLTIRNSGGKAMIRYAWIAFGVLFFVACNSSPSQTIDNTVGGANVVSSAKAPLQKATTSLTLDWGPKASGQVAIADVLSYGGAKPAITPPAGWQLIRDDSTKTTRQSLYWHAIQPSDA